MTTIESPREVALPSVPSTYAQLNDVLRILQTDFLIARLAHFSRDISAESAWAKLGVLNASLQQAVMRNVADAPLISEDSTMIEALLSLYEEGARMKPLPPRMEEPAYRTRSDAILSSRTREGVKHVLGRRNNV